MPQIRKFTIAQVKQLRAEYDALPTKTQTLRKTATDGRTTRQVKIGAGKLAKKFGFKQPGQMMQILYGNSYKDAL